MTDAPVTHEAAERLKMLVQGTWSAQIVKSVVADMRTLERELNALRQRECERQKVVDIAKASA